MNRGLQHISAGQAIGSPAWGQVYPLTSFPAPVEFLYTSKKRGQRVDLTPLRYEGFARFLPFPPAGAQDVVNNGEGLVDFLVGRVKVR